jgi:hypothetical protein
MTNNTARIYLKTDNLGALLEWSAYIRAESGIRIGVTKETLAPEAYAEGWAAYYDDLTERGFDVEVCTLSD